MNVQTFDASPKAYSKLRFWGFQSFNVFFGGGAVAFLGLIVAGVLPPFAASGLLMQAVLLAFINGSWFWRPLRFEVDDTEIRAISKLKTTRIARENIASVECIERLPGMVFNSGFAFLPLWGFHSKHYTLGGHRFTLVTQGERDLVDIRLHSGQRYILGSADTAAFVRALQS